MNGGTKLKACLFMSLFIIGMAYVTAAGRTIYVDDDGPADFNTIQAAIDDSNDGDTIIVADGIYTGEGNRDIEFSHGLPQGQTRAITVRSANGPGNCIIDCNGLQDFYDRHRGFRFVNGEDANSVIMGFTIINGYALNEVHMPPLGISEYLGGAIYCWGSNPTISNCIIKGNTAGYDGYGGGIVCFASNSTVSNCTFIGNSAKTGGGIDFWVGSPTIKNCTFSGNLASDYGGGVYNRGGIPIITNCILWGNSDSGGTDESAQIDGTTAFVNYCCIQGLTGGLGGTGNIGVDPCFIEPGYWEDPCNTPTFPWDDIWIDGDYHLKSQAGRWEPNSESWVQDAVTSHCIDAGNPGCPLGDEPVRNGNRRNMGAYGGTAEASKSPFYWRRFADLTNDWEVDSNDLKVFVDYWLETGECIPGDLNRSQSVDFADFTLLANNWLRSSCGKIVFDFAVATKGPLHLAGNIEPEGPSIIIEANVYIQSLNSSLALEMIGNSHIAGDVFITNPDATVDLQGDLFSIGGETGEAALDHVHTGVDPIAFPVPNPSYFEHYVVSDINYPSTETTFENIRIPPNTNPSFEIGTTLRGIIFIETPNVVTFMHSVNITGIIVGDGDVTDDSGTNRIDFLGTVDSSSVSELPVEYGDLRDETGTFLMAPGFSLSFGGDFAPINGAIAANGIEFYGNAGGIIEGSVLNYSDTPMELSGNNDLYFNRFVNTEMPAGFE